MNNPIEKSAYKIVLESGLVAKDLLDKLLQESDTTDSTFSQLIVKSGAMRESELLALYSKNFGIPYVQLKSLTLDKTIFAKIPVKFAIYYKFLPLKLENRKLTLAVSKLLDVNVIDEIRFGLGYEIDVVFGLERDIDEMLKQYYGLAADTVERILAQASEATGIRNEPVSTQDVQDIEKLAEAPSVVHLVNQIILEAYRKRASDIHLEPFRGKIRLRYRIDGLLQEQPVPSELKKFFLFILSRIKIMANLNIVEKRLPQDGKARVRTQEQTLDLRISAIPTPHGESLVIRILPSSMILKFEQLGFEPEHLKIFTELIRKPYGIVFLTGPTGSGKSTTLYAGLHAINSVGRKIITIEDPVEYEMDGIVQLQVAPEIGLSFARGLRSMLRHDPDVMMVGEVRDLETADIAIRVALTGHLILSTLHTNDAASGITRLLDIGVEPYLVSSSVVAFIAQRLVRTICPYCKEEDHHVPVNLKEKLIREVGGMALDTFKIFRGRGCEECHGTGFRGRTAVHEILLLDEKIRKLILARMPADQIKVKGIEMGMQTLRQNGWKKVLKGITTPEEIIQITPEDEVKKQLENSAPDTGAVGTGVVMPITLKKDPGKGSDLKTEDAASLDRRNFQRAKLHISVKYRVIDFAKIEDSPTVQSESADESGESEDISASGIAFFTSNLLAAGMLLELMVELPDDKKTIQCIGRIIRVIRIDENMSGRPLSYKVAVSFLAIPSLDRARIEAYCKINHVSP